MQSEAMVSNATKSTYQKKYKCPYCEGRFTRAKLHIHIQEKHEDLIPEGYTALRVAFNTINNKTEGHCIMCGNVTDWNEDKGRYERLCNDPKCHEAYKKMVAERTKKKYGTERLQTDPEYAEYVQRKALAGRKMHGEYTFADGGKIEYFGSYERKFLQFMDQVMHCESEDILAPAPSIKYQYEGKTHLYIPDFYYIPYNLIIEIKDGGSNPNNHPHRTGEDELKLRAKEEAIRQLNEFSYVRVVNNDFSQVLSIMAVLKYNMAHRYKDPVIKVNESVLNESILINEKDIYYNKDKFDSGEINLCFITGLSGSGKSTMGKDMQSHGIEHYDMDDLQVIADHFTLNDLKKYGDLIYSYFTGEGKKFYITYKELKDNQVPESEYEDKLFPGFVHYAMKYAKAHKDKKFVLEGVWLFQKKWFTPDEFKDYAFYIKGTSMIISHIRAAKRDSSDAESKFKQKLAFINCMAKNWKWYIIDEGQVNKFRKYFKDLMSKNVNESTLLESVSSGYPKELYSWMKTNIRYKSTGILLSPEEVEEYGYGDCHDQANYIHSKLSTKDISNGRLFVIEYNNLNSPGGKTHTAAYYKQNGKYYWIENAWYGQTGIHGPYNSIFDLKIAIANAWIWGNYKNLYVGSVNNSKIKNGMNLNDYVNACLPEDEKMIKPFITNSKITESMSGAIGSAIPLTPNPIPYECDKDNYYIIQHMQNNVFNYSITKDPVQYTMYSVDPEEHGFYKVFKTDKSKISKKYTTFKIKDKQTAKELYDELAMCEAYGKSFFAGEVSRDYIYRRLTEGSRLLSDDQIKYDTRFEQVQSFDEQIQDICEGVRSFILGDPITRLEEQVSNLANLNTLHEASTSSSHNIISSDDATTYVAKVKQAEEAEKNYGLILIYPDNIVVSNKSKEDIDRLKAKYNQYLALNQDKRTLSNRTAYNIFGYDNDTMYSRPLSKYMNSQDGYSSDNSNMVIAPINQYYSPIDKIDYSSSDVNVSHEEVVDETSWKRVIRELCVRMKNTSDSEQKNAIKSEIFMLGWNPEIPFNEEALERVRNSKHTMHIFREVDAEDYIKSIHSFNEATYEELKDKIVPVYICLFSGKALHSRAIEWYTHTEWSHAAMSFDSSMKQMYTFNANNNVSADGKSAGFTIESIEKYWKIDPSIKFKVHALFVTAAQRDMMKDAVDWYIRHQNETKYSMKTIINIFFKKASDFGNEFKNKTEMVCSQFVYTILAIANLKLGVTKDASLVSPGDLDKSIDDRLFSMFIGGIGIYSSKKIDSMCRKIIPTLPLDKYNIQ